MRIFHIYAVKIVNGEKERHFIGVRFSLDEAKHLANCATLGNADYAYVKQAGENVFSISRPAMPEDYLDPPNQQPKPQASRG